ncbi:hypothetical protein ABIB66_008276 [Bradyrhizobium sp. F1.13.3]
MRQTELARRFKAGRDRVRNAINELIAAGYIRKVQERIAGRWSAAGYDVLALPDAPAPEAPLPETPSPENRSLLSTDLLPSTDSTKKDNSPHTARAVEPSDRERRPGTYRQSPAEAACAWNEITRLDGWQTIWGEDELTHWYALLSKGHAADDIVDFAWKFLRQTPAHDMPALGDFLMYFESYLEDDDSAVSLLAQRVPAISHHPMQGA